MALVRNPEHDWPAAADAEGWFRCTRCGKPTRAPDEDTSWCRGLQQSGFGAGGGSHADDPTVYGPYHRWIGTLDCLLAGRPDHRCAGRVTGHHVRSVGAGGKDVGNEVPLCERAHRQLHRIGRTSFEERYGLELASVTERLERAWPGAAGQGREPR